MEITKGALLGITTGIGAIFLVAFTAYRIARIKAAQKRILTQGRQTSRASTNIPANSNMYWNNTGNTISSGSPIPTISSSPSKPTHKKKDIDLYY